MVGLDDFLYSGLWVTGINSASGWVTGYQYIIDHQELSVGFKSGVICIYNGIDSDLAAELYNCSSAGSFVHAELYHRNYRLG